MSPWGEDVEVVRAQDGPLNCINMHPDFGIISLPLSLIEV